VGLLLVLLFSSFLAARFAFAAVSPVTFDFDTGTPSLIPRQNTPLNQTSGGMTARFTSVSDPNKFSVQSILTNPNIQLSRFSGNYLYDNSPFAGDSMDIKFSVPLSAVNFTFATFEFHGPTGQAPSNITLTAYLDSNVSLTPWLNSTYLAPVGNMSVHGDWFSSDTYPQGTMLFNITQPFNLVRIQLPYQGPEGAVGFALDNVVAVDFSAVPEFSPVVMLMLLVVNTVVLVVIARKRGFRLSAVPRL
jgi:hypothetical protein